MKKLRTNIVAAIVNAIVVLMLSYWLGNIQMPLGGEMPLAVKFLARLQSERKEKTAELDSFLFVNTCYDIDTIPYYRHGQQEGYRAITKRSDLYTFLNYLCECQNYKYILLDIRMDKLPQRYNAYTDSLISLISIMPRIAIAKSSTFVLADSSLLSFAGDVDYLTNGIESNFLKFSILQKESLSLPLKMYHDLNQGSVHSCLGGLFYLDGHALCRKSFIPTMTISSEDMTPSRSENNRASWNYVNLDHVAECRLCNLYDGRIIVIGDLYDNDVHDTYLGKMSGALINANVYINCVQKRHVIKFIYVFLLGLFYTILFLLIISSDEYNHSSKKDFWHSDILKIILSFIGSSFILSILAVLVYCITKNIMNIMFPVIWFTIIPKIYLAIKNNH